MAKFGSLGAFRSALHDLVEHTKSNPRKRRKTKKTTSRRKKRAPRRARRNMALYFDPETGQVTADTPAEMVEFMELRRGKAPASAPPAPPPRRTTPPPRRAAPPVEVVRETEVAGFIEASPFEGFQAKPKKTRKRRGRSYTIKDPEAPVSFRMAKVIGRSVGGLDTLCPGFAKGTSFQKVLVEMGLTKGVASKVRAEMDKAGVLNPHTGFETTEEQKAIARQILFEVGGISCPTKQNPYYGY